MQKEHLLSWNSETTENLSIYLYNYQREIAIFIATKHEKTIMECSYLNFINIYFILNFSGQQYYNKWKYSCKFLAP